MSGNSGPEDLEEQEMRYWTKGLLLALSLVFTAQTALAQNVSNYDSIPEPFLFLIREPAVHNALKLSARQKEQLVRLS